MVKEKDEKDVQIRSVPTKLHQRIKIKALKEGLTITQVYVEAMSDWLRKN